MRIALVQCPPWGAVPPLGLASLKAWSELHGHEVRCHDLNIDYARERQQSLLDDVGGTIYARPDPFASESFAEWKFEFDGEVRFTSGLGAVPLPIERWADQVLAEDPEVVGFSVQASNLGTSLQVAQRVQRIRPDARIVFGGPNVTQAQAGPHALATGIPDVLVDGEGEETFMDLLDAWETGRDLAGVPGIARLVDGRPVWNESRPLMRDVDALPFPDFTDFDWNQYPNPLEIPIMTSRGCVLNCAFCYETAYWKRYRTQSAQRIVDEIVHQASVHPMAAEVGARRTQFLFSFADSLVNGHLKGMRRMADLLTDAPVNLTWGGQATINAKMDEDFFDALRRSGCTGLSFGMESGSQEVLESMGKRFRSDEATAFFQRVHDAGILLIVNVMVGFPTETRKDFLQTLWFLARIRRLIDMVNNVSSTGIVGGSRLHTNPEQFGVVPVSVGGWATGEDYRWTSKAAGDQKARDRRAWILHAWMSLLRIPHQPLATSWRPLKWFQRRKAVTVDPWNPPPVAAPVNETRWLRSLRKRFGDDPLVLRSSEQAVDEIVALPPWAAALGADAWVGVAFEDLMGLVVERAGQGVVHKFVERVDGVTEVQVDVVGPHSPQLVGLRIFTFPVDEHGTNTLAFFPVAVGDEAASTPAVPATVTTTSVRVDPPVRR